MSDACDRWVTLSDREALAEVLSEDERMFMRKHAATCADCGAERDVWSDLGTMLDVPATPAVPARRRRGLYVALAAAAGVALAFLPRAEQPPEPRSVPAYQAHASTGFEQEGQALADGVQLTEGTLVRARDDAACVRIDPGVNVCLTTGSLLRVSELNGQRRRVELLRGKLTAELAAQPAGTSFGVLTREGSSVAIGTAFTVEVPERGPVVTRVMHGIVMVRGKHGEEHRLGANETVALGQQVQEAAPIEVPVAAPAPVRTATQWLTTVRQRQARGDTAGALAAYRALFAAYPESAEARSALVPYGELLLSQGSAQLARSAFEHYLQRPGTLAEEAAYGRLRALRALGSSEERAAIERFVQRYPDSPFCVGLRQRATALDAKR